MRAIGGAENFVAYFYLARLYSGEDYLNDCVTLNHCQTVVYCPYAFQVRHCWDSDRSE